MSDPCPACGSYDVMPHCRAAACPGRWCLRAECMWENYVICTQIEPGINYARLETIDGGKGKRIYKKVAENGFGYFMKDGVFTNRHSAMGWKFVEDSTRLPWPPNELHDMYNVLVAIGNAECASHNCYDDMPYKEVK